MAQRGRAPDISSGGPGFKFSSLSLAGFLGGGGGTSYNGLHGRVPPESGTFFRLEVYKRVGKTVI